MSFDITSNKEIEALARQFDRNPKPNQPVCLVGSEIILFARQLAEQLGKYEEPNQRGTDV
jgi:hypothetical protein